MGGPAGDGDDRWAMPSSPPLTPEIPPGWFDAPAPPPPPPPAPPPPPPPVVPIPPVVPRKPMGRGKRVAIVIVSSVLMFVFPVVALVAFVFVVGAKPPCGALNHTNDCTEEQAADIAHEQEVALGVFVLASGGAVASFVVFLVTAISFDRAAAAEARRRAMGL